VRPRAAGDAAAVRVGVRRGDAGECQRDGEHEGEGHVGERGPRRAQRGGSRSGGSRSVVVVRVSRVARGEGQAPPREGGVGRRDAFELGGASSKVGVGPAGRGEVGAADLWEKNKKRVFQERGGSGLRRRKKKKTSPVDWEGSRAQTLLSLSLSLSRLLTSSCVAFAGTWSTSAASCRSMFRERKKRSKKQVGSKRMKTIAQTSSTWNLLAGEE